MKRKKKRSKHADHNLSVEWLRSGRTWMALAWLGTFAIVANGLHKLEPYVQNIKIGDTAIEWVGTPEWIQSDNWSYVLNDLESRVNLHPETLPYDESVCPWVAEQLDGSPWISQIRRISVLNDGRVRVYADFRKPFAVIEQDGFAHLIDEAGIRLPELWPSYALNREGWLAIRGVRSPTPAAGRRWGGKDVVAGLKLVRFLYRAELVDTLPFRAEIRAVDVSNFDGRQDPRGGRLRLITTNPESYIHWGLPPGEEYEIESTAESKLAMLCKLYAIAGALPDAGPIDVRDEEAIGIGSPN